MSNGLEIHQMKALLFTTLLVTFKAMVALGQVYSGPIAKPTSGYGADGSYTVAVESFTNPNFPTEDIKIYYPSGITSHVPTLFYSHAFGGNDPNNISGFLNFVAKKGYAVVFVPYQTIGVTVSQRYSNLLQGFIKAARDYPAIIDTTKVGFVGHSFGGGAVFANSYYCFTNLSWGKSGRFIFSMAQWYTYNISQEELQSFPNDVKMLSIAYENDSTNDQRMLNDVFNTINIPVTEKDYLLVKSDTIDGYIYLADHVVPNNNAFDALDYYTYYRLIDALCDYSFNGSMTGKSVALGDGSVSQVAMPGGLHSLVQTDYPNITHPESIFLYPCSSSQNPRQNYCNVITAIENLTEEPILSVFPNPSQSSITVSCNNQCFSIDIFNYFGTRMLSQKHINHSAVINTENLASGPYLVRMNLTNGKMVMCKVIKE